MADKEKTAEQMQREIMEVELETKRLQLDEQKKRNAEFKASEDRRHAHNKMRQGEFEQGRRAQKALEAGCRHKSGGSPENILRGGGKFAFSLLTRAVMPDGKTELIQCQRCRLKLHGRERTAAEEAKLKAKSPEKHAEHLEWKRLREISIEDGIEHSTMRGPTFIFQDERGVNFIPDMV